MFFINLKDTRSLVDFKKRQLKKTQKYLNINKSTSCYELNFKKLFRTKIIVDNFTKIQQFQEMKIDG